MGVDMKDFVTDRNKAMIAFVVNDDWGAIRDFCITYGVDMAPNLDVMAARIYKAVQEVTDIPDDIKVKAAVKCAKKGYTPFITSIWTDKPKESNVASSQFLVGPERRPCYVDGKKAMFHQWINRAGVISPSLMKGGHPGGQLWQAYGLVEFEDGSVMEVYPSSVKFADGGDFADTDFLPMKEG